MTRIKFDISLKYQINNAHQQWLSEQPKQIGQLMLSDTLIEETPTDNSLIYSVNQEFVEYLERNGIRFEVVSG